MRLFRDEQEKKGHVGCKCDECIIDMENALKEFKNYNESYD